MDWSEDVRARLKAWAGNPFDPQADDIRAALRRIVEQDRTHLLDSQRIDKLESLC
jgi:hypothetical protein